MTKEQLIEKGVKHVFNGKETLFRVDSLKEHFDGLLIHESDILTDEFEDQQDEYIKLGDVDFDLATPNEVVLEIQSDEQKLGMTFEEAEILLGEGELVSLPEWEGFWFKNIKTEQLLVFTKDGEILDTPHEEYKSRKDWIKVSPNEDQAIALIEYFEKSDINEISVTDAIIENETKSEDPDPVSTTNNVENVTESIPEAKITARKDFSPKTKK